MDDYLPARTSFGSSLSRLDRRTARVLDQAAADATIEMAHVRSLEAVQTAKVEALGAITAAALTEVANVSAIEAAMFERAPHAAGRLRFLADTGASTIAGVVAATGRAIR